MKLWLLKPLDARAGPWSRWYGKAFGFVIRAETELAARELATKGSGTEVVKYPDCWLDPTLTSCEPLTPNGKEELILAEIWND